MLNLYSKIINQGITSSVSDLQVRNIKLINFIAFYFTFFLLIHLVIYQSLNLLQLNPYLYCSILINLAVIFFNQKQYYKTAKLSLIVNANLVVFIYGLSFPPETTFSLYYLMILPTVFLFFNQSKKERVILIFAAALPIIGFVTLELLTKRPWIIQLDAASLKVLHWNNIATIFICSVLQLIYWIHLHRTTEKALRVSHQYMSSLFENTVEGNILFNQKGQVIKCNQAALDILGLTANQLMGKESNPPAWKCLNENGKEVTKEERPSLLSLETGKSIHGKLFCVFHNEQESRWVVSNATPIFDNSNIPFQVLVTMHDITAIKESEVKLHQAAKMSSLGEMAAGIAHEINNPLSIITGNSWLIKKEIDSDKIDTKRIHSLIDTIDNTTYRITQIVRGLLTFSHKDSSSQPMQTTFIKSIIENTLLFCSNKFANYSIKLILEDVPDELIIECQDTQISQVILNLLNNSFDAIYRSDETHNRWIKISVTEKEDLVILRITDSGQGIPKPLHQKIFLPFFTTKEIGKGTGMGLSISDSIVKAHQGTLELDANHPNTSFIISLPKYKFP